MNDFAVSVPEETIATKVFKLIQQHLKLPMKVLGKLGLYNGIVICQTKHYIKIQCKYYLTKVLQSHGYLGTTSKNIETPIVYDKTTFAKIHDIKGSDLIEDQILLTEETGFKYRSSIGEILFAAITRRPEIMYAVIKLSQFVSQLAKIHYHTVNHVFKYLRDTIDYGIYYWISKISITLQCLSQSYQMTITIRQRSKTYHSYSHTCMLTLIGLLTQKSENQ